MMQGRGCGLWLVAGVALCAFAAGADHVATYRTPARDWQRASLTGNGTIGAMARGEVADETISLSHCKLYLPEPGETPPTLVGFPRRNPADYNSRDGFMAACDLKISTPIRGVKNYVRGTDFDTGECFVEADDAAGVRYRRRVVALRPANVIAVKIEDAGRRDPLCALAGIAPSGRGDLGAFTRGIRRIVSEPDYYRCEFKNENPWNALIGYEVLLTQRRSDAARTEVFVAIEPLLKGQDSNRAALAARLAAAAEKGYDALVADNAAYLSEMMGRVAFALEGPANAADIVRNFDAGRYNIFSSTGGDHIPNLQGLWAGTWSAPWCASFTVNGNLPCAIAFFDRGRTPELNE